MMAKTTELTSMKESSTPEEGDEKDWEVRPGGMLVQKRNPNEAHNRVPPPTIRVRVKYGSIYHEIIISSQATFGELKKMLTGPTGLHHEDQKLIYKDKERASKTFLDVVGVKDKSKMVVMVDEISREKRLLEARKNSKMEKAAKSISEISLEVDRLAGQVSALESVVSKGGKVEEKMVSNLIGLLMNQLLKLDEIPVNGEVNSKKKLQVERVQGHVETLDVLMVKVEKAASKGNGTPVPKQSPSRVQLSQERRDTNGHGGNSSPTQQHHRQRMQSRRSVGKLSPIAESHTPREPSSKKTSGAVVVTTQWETFDSLPTSFPAPPSTSTSTSATSETIQPSFNWGLV